MFLLHTYYTLYGICCRSRGCRASKSLSLDAYIVLNRCDYSGVVMRETIYLEY